MSLRIRRGTDAQRSGITFDQGEIIWTIDTEKLYVGDGLTQGGKNAAAHLAGTNLAWNPLTDTLELGDSVSTDVVLEGINNLYHTPIRAQNAAAELFTTGLHSGIAFVYDDVENRINATVTGVGINNEAIQEIVASMLLYGTHNGLNIQYVDNGDSDGVININLDYEFDQDQVANMLLYGSHTGLNIDYTDNNENNGFVNINIDDEYLQDAIAYAIVNGSHSGISMFYNDAGGVIDFTASAQLQTDAAPQLGGDLDLNNFDITGYGNIDYFGTFSNGFVSINNTNIVSPLSDLNIGNITSPTSLVVTSNKADYATFKSKTSGTGVSFLHLDVYKTSLSSPTAFSGGDLTTAISARGYNPALDNHQQVFTLVGQYDSDANFTKYLPKSSLLVITGNNTDTSLTDGNIFKFDGNGTFNAPVIQTGTYSNTIERDSHLSFGTPGMIIFLSSDGTATELTGYTQVGSGATFDVSLTQSVYNVTLTTVGIGYAVGEVLTILSSALGGFAVENNIQITVDSITGGGSVGPIDTFTPSGTGREQSESYIGISASSQTGTGTAATFGIVVNDDNTYSVVISLGGDGYAIGDILTFDGTILGGASPDNDLEITVTAISGGIEVGSILSFTYTGTSHTITSTYTGVLQNSSNNTTLLMSVDATSAIVGTTISGTGIQAGTTVSSVTEGESLILSLPTTLNVSSTTFTTVGGGQPKFQGCVAAGEGTPGDPGYVAPTWVDLN